VGPSYQTQRQEAYNAFVQIVQAAPQLMNVAGDLLFKSADFPMAEELAERLQRLVPPQALGQGPSPQEQALQQQLQASQAHLQLVSERLATATNRASERDQQKEIDAYEATTKRLGTLLSAKDTDSAYASGQELRAIIQQLIRDTLGQPGMATVAAEAQQGILNNAALEGGVPNAGQTASPLGVTGLQRRLAAATPPAPPARAM
jgi:hypothetical protein